MGCMPRYHDATRVASQRSNKVHMIFCFGSDDEHGLPFKFCFIVLLNDKRLPTKAAVNDQGLRTKGSTMKPWIGFWQHRCMGVELNDRYTWPNEPRYLGTTKGCKPEVKPCAYAVLLWKRR